MGSARRGLAAKRLVASRAGRKLKYQASIDPSETNTSHAQVLDLVGTAGRVLDVGCATGYLAQHLRARGSAVTGVEIDPEAAEVARPHLAELFVADLDDTDLAQLLEPRRFDAVVFADVLEHLKDPLRALRSARSLLCDGGSIVLSVPNVAHGSVRLSLLRGSFDYRPLGLLDESHLRFYTRRALMELLAAAGLSPAEVRRTTAGPFETEIPLERTAFGEETMAHVTKDEDSRTYQFVVRAVPSDPSSTAQLAQDLTAKDQELAEARAQLADIVRRCGPAQYYPTFAVVRWAEEGPYESLRSALVAKELGHRLAEFRVRHYQAVSPEALRRDADEVCQPLLPWTQERAAQLAGELDAIVTVGAPPPEHRPILEALRAHGVPSFQWGVPLPGQPGSPAHPAAGGEPRASLELLLLADRLLDDDLGALRTDYLRVIGELPERGGVLLCDLSDETGDRSASLRALADLARRRGLELVGVAATPGAPEESSRRQEWSVDPTEPIDLVAAVSHADLVVSDREGTLALGLATRRPTIALSPCSELRPLLHRLADSDLVAERPAAVAMLIPSAESRAADSQLARDVQDEIDWQLDDLAERVAATIGRRATESVPQRLAALSERVGALEEAYSALLKKLADERAALGARARQHLNPEPPDSVRTWHHLDRQLQSALDATEQVRAELDAVYQTRTMRVLRPARAAYSRFRNRLR